MRRLWNIVWRVDVGLACVDIGLPHWRTCINFILDEWKIVLNCFLDFLFYVEKIWLVNYVVISKVSFVVVGLFLTHLHCDNSCDMFFCQTDVSNWCAQPEEPNISIKSGLCDG